MDHQQHDDAEGEGEVVMAAACEEVRAMIKKKYYREASECLKMVMEAYQEDDLWLQKYSFCLLIISETLHYANIILPNCGDDVFDYYSVLHLPPSSTFRQVKDRFFQLRDALYPFKNKKFHILHLAESLLYLAKSNLCEGDFRSDFDIKRKDCVFLDWPPQHSKPTTTTTTFSSLKVSYLDWKPPVYRVDAIHHMKSTHLHYGDDDDDDDDDNKEEVVVVNEEVGEEEESEDEGSDDDDESDEEEEEEEEEEEDASLCPQLRILKKKVFDEMPQNPHYAPLYKYSGRVRQGMILGLEVAFTELCGEIKNSVDVQSFWYELDGFNEETSQLKQMGYNVEKVKGRIDILKSIAKHKRASKAAAKKCENEVRDREANVIDLQTRISELQTEIQESKSKIQTFNKDSSDAVAKFAATVKSKWV